MILKLNKIHDFIFYFSRLLTVIKNETKCLGFKNTVKILKHEKYNFNRNI